MGESSTCRIKVMDSIIGTTLASWDPCLCWDSGSSKRYLYGHGGGWCLDANQISRTQTSTVDL